MTAPVSLAQARERRTMRDRLAAAGVDVSVFDGLNKAADEQWARLWDDQAEAMRQEAYR